MIRFHKKVSFEVRPFFKECQAFIESSGEIEEKRSCKLNTTTSELTTTNRMKILKARFEQSNEALLQKRFHRFLMYFKNKLLSLY